MTPFQKVSIIEASHFDAQTAYAAINTLRLDDLHPHILRTRDSGKTWTETVNGIPANENVNAVREILCDAAASLPQQSARSMCRLMMATTGSRCGSTWPQAPCVT